MFLHGINNHESLTQIEGNCEMKCLFTQPQTKHERVNYFVYIGESLQSQFMNSKCHEEYLVPPPLQFLLHRVYHMSF
jgi:hypothetical protein